MWAGSAEPGPGEVEVVGATHHFVSAAFILLGARARENCDSIKKRD